MSMRVYVCARIYKGGMKVEEKNYVLREFLLYSSNARF